MKISYASDIHLEFYDITLDNEDDSELLILAGDIVPVVMLNQKKKFFNHISKQWNNIIIVLGNHDLWGTSIQEGYKRWYTFLEQFPNITLLQNQSIIINDIKFIGATLWTNYYNNNPLIMTLCQNGMCDNNKITGSSAQSFLEEFNTSVEYIKQNLEHDKIVLITHHAPSLQSIAPEYKLDRLSAAFASDLDYLFYDNSNIKIALHGHTHTPFDYMIQDTNILANPRGYPHEVSYKIFLIQSFYL